MTTPATSPTATDRSAVGAPPRWRDLLGAEWIKLCSLRSTLIVLACIVVLAWYVAYDGANQAYTAWPGFEDDFKQIFDPGHETLYPPAYLLLMTVAGAIGAQTVVGEHANGLIRTTFIAVPARSRVVLAKAAVVTAALTVVGLLVGVGSWGIAMAIYSDRITAFSWTTPGLPGLLAAVVITFPVSGLIGMAVGTLIRNGPVTVFVLFVNFMIVPMGLLAPDDKLLHTGNFFEQVSNALPFSAFLQLTHIGSGHIVGYHPSDTEAWIALPVWGIVSCVIAVTVLRHRDV
ncbi:ABC transporter permease subunit [Kitasatospora sp. NPDC093806]|uniref:ABC transporter permease subunit n=1 Tax=Kitasatospora sp. NPDC093806 TaxID=3155075 RepID=UPI00343FDD47